MRFDLHIHSKYSKDTVSGLRQILKHAKKVGLDGLAITDHNTVKGSMRALQHARDFGMMVIPGAEVSTSNGHILALGISMDVKPGLSPAETMDKVEEQGGIAVAAHPYRFRSGLGETSLRVNNFKAIEVWNSMSIERHNLYARRLARELGTGMTGGSDAHELNRIGMAYTDFINPVSCLDDLLFEIEKGNTIGDGQTRGMADTLHYTLRAVRFRLKMGMRTI